MTWVPARGIDILKEHGESEASRPSFVYGLHFKCLHFVMTKTKTSLRHECDEHKNHHVPETILNSCEC